MYFDHVIIKHVKYLFNDAIFIILAPELMLILMLILMLTLMLMFSCNS